MKKITVHLGSRSYAILIGRNLIPSLGRFLKPLRLGSKILIVSNQKIARLFLKPVSVSLKHAGFQVSTYLLPYGSERDKSAKELFGLWNRMAEVALDRTSSVLALGGGVIGDTAGFAASTYMRGISLIQVPTTLLAQVDSAIGGKTAIDLPLAKNMAGTFHQPRIVICDVSVLKTLALKEFQNSFAEVLKYGVIRDSKLFELLEKKVDSFFSSLKKKTFWPRQYEFLETVVWRSALVKAKVVERDERETKGERMILNYGHTFGHALEAASKFQMPHGEAIGIGMVLAARLAAKRGIFTRQSELRQMNLIRRIGLPIRSRFSASQILPLMKRDKKASAGKLKLVLPLRIGKVEVMGNISDKEVRKLFNA